MHLYTAQAPNPFRVNVFLAEKNIVIPSTSLNVMEGDTRSADFLKKNSLCEVPVLELDDGTYLTESIAICRYLEHLHPENPLMGETPLAQARVEMWNRRMEQQIFGAVGNIGLHTIPFFADKVEQIPEYAKSMKSLLEKKWAWLDGELADGRTYICDDAFSVADITGMAALFVCEFIEIDIPDNLTHLQRWVSAVRADHKWG
ncbi:MAG: glutathione S-transferase family protein [Pseudomonadales bacterium]|nr:glutathione S-transferase family protein [Pseudomonadales bacterium]